MQKNHKQTIFNIMKILTGYNKEQIIMNYNNKAKPSGDFLTIHFGAISSDESEEYLDENGEPVIFFDEEVILNVYTKEEKAGKLIMQKIKKFMLLEKIQALLNADEMVYIDSSNIFDLTELLNDKANTYQYRAQIILNFRYFEENDLSEEDKYDIIKDVEGNTNLPFNEYSVTTSTKE